MGFITPSFWLSSVGTHPVSSLHIYTFVVSRAFMAGAASQAGDADSSRAPGLTSGLQGSVNVHRCAQSIVGATVRVRQFFCVLHFCHTSSLCRVELVVQFPARGSTQVLLCLFLVCCGCDTFYSVCSRPVSSLHIYTFVVSRAFMAGAATQAADADSSRAPSLTSGLQGSVNVHGWCSIVGATVTVRQFFCVLHFCHTCSLCRVELEVQFPAMGSTQVLLCLFPGVLWL